MNVIELLKADHDAVSDLFKSFESAAKSESDGEKRQIVDRICDELDVHAKVEEELFYPAVEARASEDEKAETSVLEAHEEHALVKTLIAELRDGSARADGQREAKVKVLKDLVEHHVGEEEGTMMPRAKKLLTSEELEELGQRTESRKQELRAGPADRRERRSAGRSSSSSRRASARSSSSGSRRAAPGSSRSAGSPRGRSGRQSGNGRSGRGRAPR